MMPVGARVRASLGVGMPVGVRLEAIVFVKVDMSPATGEIHPDIEAERNHGQTDRALRGDDVRPQESPVQFYHSFLVLRTKVFALKIWKIHTPYTVFPLKTRKYHRKRENLQRIHIFFSL